MYAYGYHVLQTHVHTETERKRERTKERTAAEAQADIYIYIYTKRERKAKTRQAGKHMGWRSSATTAAAAFRLRLASVRERQRCTAVWKPSGIYILYVRYERERLRMCSRLRDRVSVCLYDCIGCAAARFASAPCAHVYHVPLLVCVRACCTKIRLHSVS